MKHRQLKIIILLAIGLLSCRLNAYAKAESISGKIYEVYPNENELTVSTIKSDGNTTQIIPIKVDSETEYAGVTNLADLKLDQSVQIEFMQNQDGFFMAKSLTASPVKAKEDEKKGE